MVWNTTNSAAAEKNSNYCATNFPNNPYVCGKNGYSVPPRYTHWQDLSGTNHNVSESTPFMIGLNPVLLEP